MHAPASSVPQDPPALRAVKRAWSALVEPHARITAAEDRHGARLFAILMLVHVTVVGIFFGLIWWANRHYLGHDIRDDADTGIILSGTAFLLVPYGMLRLGLYHPAVAIYIAVTAALPLLSPFMPGPNAEIGFLSMLILAPLLAAFVYPARWVIAILSGTALIAGVRLATAGLPAGTVGTGCSILMVEAVAGAMLLVFHHRTTVLERLRMERLMESETALRRTSERLRFLLANSMDIILGIDRDGTIRFIGGAVEATLGWQLSDLLGLSIFDLVAQEDAARVRNRFARIDAAGGISAREEWRQKRSDGAVRWMEVLISNQLGNPDVAAILLNLRDVTERRLADEERMRIAEKVEDLARVDVLGRMAGGVAHDFNNLLTVILGNLELADPDHDSPTLVAQRLARIREAAEKSAALARLLLVYSGRDVTQPAILHLDNELRAREGTMRQVFGPDVEIALELASAPGTILFDPAALERVIMTLAINARDAMPEGGQFTLATELVGPLPGTPESAGVRLTVTDTGSGMTSEVQEHLFEPFFTTKPRRIGTGLGLATLRGSVEQAGGAVAVESAPGRGTVFTIDLPRADNMPAAGTPATIASTGGSLDGTESILYAEDNEMIRTVTVDILTRRGYRVTSAPDGAAALELARSMNPPAHLLLTDMIMPGLNGRQLAAAFAALHPESRILLTSGYTEDILADPTLPETKLAFIGKPYTGRELAAKIREVLAAPAGRGAART